MKIYHHPKCSTCRKALQFLHAHALHFEAVDIRSSPPSREELKKMLAFHQGKLRKLFNSSGQIYRKLNLKQRLLQMTASEALTLLEQDGMLVKRPFVLTSQMGLVGFNANEWASLV